MKRKSSCGRTGNEEMADASVAATSMARTALIKPTMFCKSDGRGGGNGIRILPSTKPAHIYCVASYHHC